jgi:hypothetical protein
MKPVLLIAMLVATLAVSAQAATGGIGVLLDGDVAGARVISVVPGGPADKAGVKAGDVIVAADDRPLAGLGPEPVVATMRGPIGTSVRLAIASGRQRRTVTVVRGATAQIPASPSAVPSSAAATLPAAARTPAPGITTRPAAATTTATTIPQASGTGRVAFAPWVEPRERSFTVDVPRGWQVNGGLNWTGPIDPQLFVHAKTADGKAEIFVGDPEILPRQVPSQISSMQSGVREGGVFRTPSGGRALLQRYLTGTEFARLHVGQRLCRQPRWLREAGQPDLARDVSAAIAPEARAYGVMATANAGEAGFTCGDALGYAAATTVLVQSPSSPLQFWAVFTVAGFKTSDPARAMEARFIMEHMVATLKRDPAWERAWEQRVRQVTGSVISMQNAATQASLRAARNAADTLARLNHPNAGVSRPAERPGSRVNTVLGTRDVCDAIGRCKTVSNDAETVFMDHSGNVARGRAGGAPPDNTGVWAPMN